MNHIHRVPIVSSLLISVLCVTALGASTSAPARAAVGVAVTPQIDDSAKTQEFLSAEAKKLIQSRVAAMVGELSDADPTVQKRSRELIVRELTKSDGRECTAAYLDQYCMELNNALLAGPMAQPNMKARLNAGLVVAKVAETTPSFRLEPVVLRLIGKGGAQPDAVVLWGMRASTQIILGAVKQARPTPLLAELVPAVKAHPIAAVTQEAYVALIIEPGKDVPPAVLNQSVIPELLKLFAFRVEQYRKCVPPDPEMEPSLALKYLTRLNIFGNAQVVNAKQQAEIAQLINDYLTRALRQVPTATPEQFEQLVAVFSYTAACIEVLAEVKNDPALKDAAQAAKTLAPNRETPQSVQQAVEQPLLAALKKTFPNIAPTPP